MIALLFLVASGIASASSQIVYFHWNYINFTWPSADAYHEALYDGTYVPENITMTGIKVWKDRLYLTLPRWKTGVPATLVSTPLIPIDGDSSPLLEPYPNWEMQRLDDCHAFQYVQSMEIDPLGRMWILENGRTEYLTRQRNVCPARLVVLDLDDHGRVLIDYVFPDHVVNQHTVFLNDIVLDHEDGGWAYITNTDSDYPGIIVFSLKEKTSWRLTHPTMYVSDEATKIIVNGTELDAYIPVDGIALSPASKEGSRMLYYSPVSSYETFAVPVEILKNPNESHDLDGHVTLIGRKTSQTDGMVMSSTGKLYLTYVGSNAIARWNTNKSTFADHLDVIIQDDDVNQWPDTLAIDEFGQLWWTSNRLQRFINNEIDLREVNYRVMVLDTPDKNYQYYEDGSSPVLPDIHV